MARNLDRLLTMMANSENDGLNETPQPRSERFFRELERIFREFWAWYISAPLGVRLLGASMMAVIWAAILYPYQANFYPEGNWLRGPLWLFKIQADDDKLVGLASTMALLPLIVTFAFQPARWSAMTSLVGIALWVTMGIWLARLAVI